MTLDEEVAARGYQYKHGDRPLEGFTIQRAAGRGGFGEVYFAVSDGGREVALKLVLTYEQIELRGISQCMNLKSPQLVTIFDVKHGADGRPWVIMEYVAGPSLRGLLDAAPNGLGAAKAAFFLREIGKGLTYLHECGIVHRDLKPGNIFYENGYVKIGDYGLSKAMSMTKHSGQTVAVGTLHYMAPEIGEGRYDRTIDIYALGALLYEMLTGQVPFYGSSPAEVLMKHLTSQVSLDGIEEPFQSAIRKAMAKNPAERFQSVQELVDAVFASEAVRAGVAQLSPASLTQVGGQTAQYKAVAPENDYQTGYSTTLSENAGHAKTRWLRKLDRKQRTLNRLSAKLERAGERIKRAGDRFAGQSPAIAVGESRADPLSPAARIFAAAMATLLAAFVAGITSRRNDFEEDVFFCVLAIVGAMIGLKLAWALMGSTFQGESHWVQRFILGAPTAIGAAVLSLPFWSSGDGFQTTFETCFGTLLLMQWDKRIAPGRRERLAVGDLFTSGLCAFFLGGFQGDRHPATAVITVVGASAVASLSSAWRRSDAAPMAPSSVPDAPSPASPLGAFEAAPTIGASPVFNPGGQNEQFGGLKEARKAGNIAWVLPIALISLCFVTIGHNPRPQGILLLIVAAIVLSHFLKRKRGGFMSSAGTIPSGEMIYERSSLGGFASSVGRGFAGLIGSILLTVSVLLALCVAVNLPALFESGVVNPRLPRELTLQFGTPQWPRLLLEAGTGLCLVTSVVSMIFLLLARRHGGVAHLIRTVVGVLVLLAAAIQLGRQLPDLGNLMSGATPGQTLDLYFQQVQFSILLKAAINFLLGAFLLGWPAKPFRPASILPRTPYVPDPIEAGKKFE